MKWTITLGVVPGYENTKTEINLDEIGAIYQTIALRVYEHTNVYVSATLAESRTLYATSWGCPLGGESTVTFSGCHNPAFAGGIPERARRNRSRIERVFQADDRAA